MDIKQEHTESMNMIRSTYESARAKAILTFAEKKGLEKATVTCPDGSKHAAGMYAFHLWCNASNLSSSTAEEMELFQVVSLMSALEECAVDNWSYGTRLIYDMRSAGVAPTRREVALFLSMEGGWENPEKNTLLECDPHAVTFYGGRLLTLYHTLPNITCFKQNSTPISLPERKATSAETIESLAQTFVPECIGQNNAPKLIGLLKYLRSRSDFYTNTGSNSYEEGFLANHAVDVIYKLVELAKPCSPADTGACVLAGLGMDLGECQTIRKVDKNSGTVEFDVLPFGHGRKSLFILGAYLDNCLPENVASAIDAHMHDTSGNPRTPLQMMEQPLGLYLHIADVATVYKINTFKTLF